MPKLIIEARTHSADTVSLLSSSKLKSRLVFQIWRMLPDESMAMQRSATRQLDSRFDIVVVWCVVVDDETVDGCDAVDGVVRLVVCVDVVVDDGDDVDVDSTVVSSSKPAISKCPQFQC